MDQICELCFVDLGTEQTYTLDCKHIFHVACIVKRFRTVNKKECPVCTATDSSAPLPLDRLDRFRVVQRAWNKEKADIVEKCKEQVNDIKSAKRKLIQWGNEIKDAREEIEKNKKQVCQTQELLDSKLLAIQDNERESEIQLENALISSDHARKLSEETRLTYIEMINEKSQAEMINKRLRKKTAIFEYKTTKADAKLVDMESARTLYENQRQELVHIRASELKELQRLMMSEPKIGSRPVYTKFPNGHCRFCGYESMPTGQRQCEACEKQYLNPRSDFRSEREQLVDRIRNVMVAEGANKNDVHFADSMTCSSLNVLWKLLPH